MALGLVLFDGHAVAEDDVRERRPVLEYCGPMLPWGVMQSSSSARLWRCSYSMNKKCAGVLVLALRYAL